MSHQHVSLCIRVTQWRIHNIPSQKRSHFQVLIHMSFQSTAGTCWIVIPLEGSPTSQGKQETDPSCILHLQLSHQSHCCGWGRPWRTDLGHYQSWSLRPRWDRERQCKTPFSTPQLEITADDATPQNTLLSKLSILYGCKVHNNVFMRQGFM